MGLLADEPYQLGGNNKSWDPGGGPTDNNNSSAHTSGVARAQATLLRRHLLRPACLSSLTREGRTELARL